MTLSRVTLIAIIVVAATIAGVGRAEAQYFPDDKMTKGLQRDLDSVASKYGAAFVSSCRGPGDGETAILFVPVGARSGTLAFLLSGKWYNGAEVQLKAGKPDITEGGGGQWSLGKLQFYADTMTQGTFRLESRDQLRALLTSEPTSPCPAYH
jgi:hypothetical protein